MSAAGGVENAPLNAHAIGARAFGLFVKNQRQWAAEGFDRAFAEFDAVIGFSYLRGMHINDSKKEHASRVDRHELIGKGTLGNEVFVRLMNDPRFDNIPIILETPDETRWKEEIAFLYGSLKDHG